MSYYAPSCSPELSGQPLFSIVPLNLVVDQVSEALLVFDLPSELIVCLGDIEIPSRVFDYFNPLIVSPDHQPLFYQPGETVPLNSFSCQRLVVARPGAIEKFLESTIHYPPNYDVDYQTMTVTRNLRASQLCQLLTEIEAEPRHYLPSLHTSMARLLGAMLRPIDGEGGEFLLSFQTEEESLSDPD